MISMPMMSPSMTALMTVAMMVAMMLPSIAPTLWRYHRHLRAMRMPRAGQRTTLFAVGYASVWTTIGLALFAMSAELSPMGMTAPTDPPFARWAGVAILCVGAMESETTRPLPPGVPDVAGGTGEGDDGVARRLPTRR
jgi:predicted metal-binding membrane protein